jgi:hypothetical protein
VQKTKEKPCGIVETVTENPALTDMLKGVGLGFIFMFCCLAFACWRYCTVRNKVIVERVMP